jgi:hypothetical protein
VVLKIISLETARSRVLKDAVVAVVEAEVVEDEEDEAVVAEVADVVAEVEVEVKTTRIQIAFLPRKESLMKRPRME